MYCAWLVHVSWSQQMYGAPKGTFAKIKIYKLSSAHVIVSSEHVRNVSIFLFLQRSLQGLHTH